MLTIYDSNGNRRTDIEAGDSSTQVKEVQGDNVLTCLLYTSPSPRD